jgi:hypothetical protein
MECEHKRILDWWSDLLDSFDTVRDYTLQFIIIYYTEVSTVTSSLGVAR